MEEEIEDVRRRKLLELQRRMEEEQAIAEEKRQIENQRRSILATLLTPEARERLANIKLAKPEFGAQIENLLIQLAQSGKINEKITDQQLKSILIKISEKKKEIKIRRI